MARVTKTELVIEGYRADINGRETVVRATSRAYDQRDERAYEVALLIPTDDLARVANLLRDASTAAGEMVNG